MSQLPGFFDTQSSDERIARLLVIALLPLGVLALHAIAAGDRLVAWLGGNQPRRHWEL